MMAGLWVGQRAVSRVYPWAETTAGSKALMLADLLGDARAALTAVQRVVTKAVSSAATKADLWVDPTEAK